MYSQRSWYKTAKLPFKKLGIFSPEIENEEKKRWGRRKERRRRAGEQSCHENGDGEKR